MLICLNQNQNLVCGTENQDKAHYCRLCGQPLRQTLQLHNPGAKVGPYRILQLIGWGRFGAVYETQVVARPDVRVALKETFDSSSFHAVEREFRVLHNLCQPNLPRYLETFVAKGISYLVMEFVPGQSLEEILKKGPVSEKLALFYIEQLCDALSYLHGQAQPIIHRDIKPANILLTPKGLIKLVDFGLVKQVGPGQTSPSIRAISLPYSAPEQWSGGTDQRSDLYSLGATLYHLLTGYPPPSATDRSLNSSDSLQPPQVYNPEITPHVAQAILTAMNLKRENRYPNVELLREALQGRIKRSSFGTNILVPPASAPTLGPTIRMAQKQPSFSQAVAPQIAQVQPTLRLQGHTRPVFCVTFSPDGCKIASGSSDQTVRVWRVAEGKLCHSLRGKSWFRAVTFSPDNHFFVGAGEDEIIVWSATDGHLVQRFAAKTKGLNSLAFSSDGQLLTLGGNNTLICPWPLEMNASGIKVILEGVEVAAVAFSPDGEFLVTGGSHQPLILWRVADGALLKTFPDHSNEAYCLAWQPGGTILASSGPDSKVYLWDIFEGRQVLALQKHTSGVRSLAWSPDGHILASGGSDMLVNFWGVPNGQLLHTLRGHSGVAWGPNPTTLATWGKDNGIQLWEVKYK